jgi:hypothetical protein
MPGSGNVLKVQQLLHICSEHYEAKEKEEEKDKKDKKDKDKKESAADMGSHQVCQAFVNKGVSGSLAFKSVGPVTQKVAGLNPRLD